MDQQKLLPSPNPSESLKSDNSIDSFLKEVETPTTAALDTPAVQAPIPDYTAIPSSAPPPPPPPKPGERVFTSEDTEPGNDRQDIPPAKPHRSADYAQKVMHGLVTAEEFAASRICAIVADTDDVAQFKYSEDDKDTLVTLMEPFEDWILDKCPAGLPLLMVYAGLKTDQVFKARKIAKLMKKNKAAATDGNVKSKVAQAAANEDNRPRTRFTINKKGEYTYDRYGNYAPVGERELASIDDLDQLLESNKPSVVQEAFNLTDADLRARGVEI